MAWFLRLSPDGREWVGEDRGRILRNGRVVGMGIQPHFSLEGQALWVNGPSVLGDRGYSYLSGQSINYLDTNARGDWVAWHGADPLGYTLMRDGVATRTLYPIRPAIGPTGHLWFPPNGCIEPRWNEGGVLAILAATPGNPPRVVPSGWAPWLPRTDWAVPILGPAGQSWVLRIEGERLVLHPYGDPIGYEVAPAPTSYPDAVWDGTVFVLAWTDAAGATVLKEVSPNQPRVDLSRPVQPPAAGPPAPGVQVVEWTPTLQPGLPWKVVANDRNNPGAGTTVELIPADSGWSVHVELRNPSGSDRTGLIRRVELVLPEPEPIPEPDPDTPLTGLCWPLPHEDPVSLSPEWLRMFRDHGYGLIRADFYVERSRESLLAQAQAIQDAGLGLLPILSWPWGHPEPADLVAYVEWFLDHVNVGWVELGNEPWILHKVSGEEYLRIARPMALAAEARGRHVLIAADLFDHSTGRSRRWPGEQAVLDFIAESPARFASLHPYRNPHSPSFSPWGSREAEHAALVQKLGHSRYVVTEVGWKPSEGPEQASGRYHVEELRIQASIGVPLVCLYTHIEDPHAPAFDFGLFEFDGPISDNRIRPREAASYLKVWLPEAEPLPPVEPNPSPPVEPDPSTAFRIRTDFLGRWAHPDGPLFMIGGMPPEQRQRQYEWMDSKGWTHVPIAVHNDYPRFDQWTHMIVEEAGLRTLNMLDEADWRLQVALQHQAAKMAGTLAETPSWWDQPDQLVALLQEIRAAGKHPILVLHPKPGWTIATHLDQVRQLWPHVAGLPSLVMWGWEINDLGGDWANGTQQLGYLSHLQAITAGAPLVVHFTPERWSGWPSFDGSEPNKEEVAWLIEARKRGVWGLAYQEPPEKSIPALVERTLRLPSPHGYSPGICGRVVDGSGLRFWMFEFARDEARHAEVTQIMDADSRVGGVG